MACNNCKQNPTVDCGCKSITPKCGSCDKAYGCDKKECNQQSSKNKGCKITVPTSCVKYNGMPLGYSGALAGDDLNKILASFDEIVGIALNNTINTLGEAIAEALENNVGVKNAIQNCIKDYIQDNPDVIGDSVVSFIQDGDKTILTALLNNLSELLQENDSTIENLFGDVLQNFFENNPNGISNLFNLFLEEIQDGNVQVIDVFSEIIEQIFNNNDELLQTFIENLTEILNTNEDVEQAFVELITNLFNENPQLVCDVLSNCSGVIGGVPYSIMLSESVETDVCNKTQNIVITGTAGSTENIEFSKSGNAVVIITDGSSSITLDTNTTGTLTVTFPSNGEIAGTISLADISSSTLSSTDVYYTTSGGNLIKLTTLNCVDFNCVDNVAPVASFNIPSSIIEGQTTTLTDSSTDSDGTIVSWSWSTSDGQSSTSQNANFTWASSGTYTVTLTVTDNVGVSSSVTNTVTVVQGTNPSPQPSTVFTNNQTATSEIYNLSDSTHDIKRVTSTVVNLPATDVGTRKLQIKSSLSTTWNDVDTNSPTQGSTLYTFSTLSTLFAATTGSSFSNGRTYNVRTCADDGVNPIVYSTQVAIEIINIPVQPYTITATAPQEGSCASCRSLEVTNATGANITVEFIKTGAANYGTMTEFIEFDSDCWLTGDIVPSSNTPIVLADQTTQRYTYGIINSVTTGTTEIVAVVRDSGGAVLQSYNIERISNGIGPC